MRPSARIVAISALGSVAAAACMCGPTGVETRRFACNNGNDCAAGYDCVQGECVPTGSVGGGGGGGVGGGGGNGGGGGGGNGGGGTGGASAGGGTGGGDLDAAGGGGGADVDSGTDASSADSGGGDAGVDSGAADSGADAGFDAGFDAGTDAGPRGAYKYRRRININNTASSTLPTTYTVRVPFTASIFTGKVRSDQNDIRIFSDAPNLELNRLIDNAPPGQSPAIWFALAAPISSGATNINYWIYYGDPNAAAPPADGKKVFAFYDDFSGALNPLWMTNDAPLVSGGTLRLRQGHQDALTTDSTTDNVPTVSVFEAAASVTDPNSNADSQGFYWWIGYQHNGDFTASDPWILWISRGANSVQTEQKTPGACSGDCTAGTTGENTAVHWYRIERQPSQTVFFLDGVNSATAPTTNVTDYSLMLRNFCLTSDVVVDFVRARALVEPEPGVTLGAEEILH